MKSKFKYTDEPMRNMNKPNQRKGSPSNAHVGAAFEAAAYNYFKAKGIDLTKNYYLELGIGDKKKKHCFDLGSSESKTIVECKSHTWTEGNKVPSAKLTVWNEAMYYFYLAPAEYKKVLFVKHDERQSSKESLLHYYLRTYAHLVPLGVQFIEYDELSGKINSVKSTF